MVKIKQLIVLFSFFLCLGYTAMGQNVQVIKYPALEKMFKQSKDTVLIVNFWATWCKPCIEELPYFENISKKYEGTKVKVVLINLDVVKDLTTKVKPFVGKNNIRSSDIYLLDEPDYNSWIDKVSADWSGSLPFTLIVGSDNKIRKTFEEPLTESQLEKEIQPFIKL
ncbi:TlpA family protein disulfide reductase [Emticicia agri]|uniref:TlpA family protein disulfide reductase n=1 Tax=Emticicia agri TaxID=2492393 RepID=A0A4Q5LXT1_9BACT|nr:TlpA disulfide reductase family protein [Emticicia agri]RYU94588.1 TlpA family protein disulfide reductase [Emticicia agri]